MDARVISAAMLLLSAVPAHVMGRPLLSPTTTREAIIATARGMAIERGLFKRQLTVRARSMRDLVNRTAPISRDAFVKYQGNWQSYWAASNTRNQRAGKTIEAVFAWRVNAQRAQMGISDRMLVTAVEGFPTYPADLIDVAPDGTILRKYQVKWGWKNTIKALQDPKYEGMRILTTHDSLIRIERQLQLAEAKVARRGLILPRKWQIVRDAIDSGRLPRSWAGKRLPRAKGIQRLAQSQVERYFTTWAKRVAPRATARVGQSLSLLRASGKAMGRAVIVADFGGTIYVQYVDVNRFRTGEIGGGYLAFKSTLRASQLSLTAYAIATLDPFTKIVAGVAAGVLVVVDIASDPVYRHVYQRRQDAAAAVLASVDREERYHAARRQLLGLSGDVP